MSRRRRGRFACGDSSCKNHLNVNQKLNHSRQFSHWQRDDLPGQCMSFSPPFVRPNSHLLSVSIQAEPVGIGSVNHLWIDRCPPPVGLAGRVRVLYIVPPPLGGRDNMHIKVKNGLMLQARASRLCPWRGCYSAGPIKEPPTSFVCTLHTAAS